MRIGVVTLTHFIALLFVETEGTHEVILAVEINGFQSGIAPVSFHLGQQSFSDPASPGVWPHVKPFALASMRQARQGSKDDTADGLFTQPGNPQA